MSLLTTWTTVYVPTRRMPADERPTAGPRPSWHCANCTVLNPGARRRCTDCGTTRD